MTCNYIYIGQKWTSADLKFGKGSIYLAGPRNRRGRSWRLDACKKISAAIDATILVPESIAQLKGGASRTSDESNRWQKFAIGSSTAILFWYPKDSAPDSNIIDIEAWCTADRVFIGKDPENQNPSIIKLLDNPKVTIFDSLDTTIENIIWYLNK